VIIEPIIERIKNVLYCVQIMILKNLFAEIEELMNEKIVQIVQKILNDHVLIFEIMNQFVEIRK
jgi:hypothetical protein